MTPDTWPYVSLKRLLRFGNGTDHTSVENSEGKYRVFGSGGPFALADDFLYEGESVLFGRKGTVDKPRYVNEPFWVVDTAYFTIIGPKLVPRWLYYWAMTIPFAKYSTNTALPSMTSGVLGSLHLKLPSVAQQEEIIDFLDRETSQIDKMIEAQEDLIKTLEERRDSVLLSILFSDQGLHDEPVAWYGASQWDAPKLWRHTKITNGSTPRRAREDYWGGGLPWLNSSVVNLDTVTDADQFVTETALKECHLPIIPAGATLVGLTGQGKTRGKATELKIKTTINQHIAAVIPDVNYWNPRFLTLALRSAYGELRRTSDANGATKGALTCEALSAFRIPMPPLNDQESLARKADETTSRTNELITAANDVITLLRERREALITAAVIGRIDTETGIEHITHPDHADPTTLVSVRTPA